MKMKKVICIMCLVAVLASCKEKKTGSGAVQLYERISLAYKDGRDSACLQGIAELRSKYPDAIEERKKALELYQKASLRMSQHELERTMRELDAVNASYNAHKRTVEARHNAGTATAKELSDLTFERMHRDSLQVRYDVLCSQIRYIHKRERER